MEPKEVFISYKREQIAIDFVAVLKRELEVNGFSVWLDSDGGIKPGSNIAAGICKGVDECKTFIPVMTKKYCDSKWCMDELHRVNYSKEQQKKLIIPVILEDIPSATESEKAFHLMMDSICYIKCKPGDDYTEYISKIITTLKGLGTGMSDDDSTRKAAGKIGKIQDADIANIAGELPQWQTVAKNLGFGRQTIKDFEDNNRTPEKQRVSFLTDWIENIACDATYEKLCDVLEKLREKGAAERIRKIQQNSGSF